FHVTGVQTCALPIFRQMRNLLATLMVSQGVPMLLAGDECGRTQLGNNNAYCQDNEITWHDWSLSDEDQNLLTFARELIHLRKSQIGRASCRARVDDC